MATVRYFVADVDRSIDFYSRLLGFSLKERWGPAIAMVEKDGLLLWLSSPVSSAAQPMPDGSKPSPGGWNRFVVLAEDIDGMATALKSEGVSFRNEVFSGPGGSQVLVEDPDGNPIEIFQPRNG
jgi:catechol 2,3-dioxygenase-like lactoylglutathione lyase family enzyme